MANLQVLIVEDSKADAELVVRELRRTLGGVDFLRVETREALVDALGQNRWDVVICDNRMPSFNGSEALRLVKHSVPDLPFILVSGTVGEEAAVELLKAGADDYLLKGNLARLPAAIQQQLREAGERHARRQSEQALRESEERFRQLAENVGVFFYLTDPQNTRIFYASPAYEQIWGRSLQSLYENPRSWFDAVHPEDRELVSQRMQRTASEPTERQYRIVRPDGALRWIRSRGFPVRDSSGMTYRIAGVAEDITDAVHLQDELRKRDAGLRRAQLMAKLGHVITGPDGAFESWSETLPQLIGVDPAQMPGSTREWLNMLHPDDVPLFRGKAIQAADKLERTDVEYRLRRTDGRWIQLRQVMEPMKGHADGDGKVRWFSTLQDVTEQKQAERKIKRLNRVYAVLSGINALIVRVRDRKELLNEACRVAVEAGQFPLAWIGVVDRGDQRVKAAAWAGDEHGFVQFVRPTVDAIGTGRAGLSAQAIDSRRPVTCNDIEADGSAMRYAKEALERGYRSAAALPLVVDGTAIGALVLYAGETGFFDEDEIKLLLELAGDISFALDHLQKAEKLNYLAYYDDLTGLANSTLFRERLEQHIVAAANAQRSFALVVVNVNRFRAINDAFGRQAGDELLKQIADRFVIAAGDSNRLARIGADHFAYVGTTAQSEEEIARRTDSRLNHWFGSPYRVGANELRISVAAGIALFPNDGTDGEELLKNAEAALEKAKATGERYLFFEQRMTGRIAENFSLENRLRQALEKDEFVLHYQPKVDVETRKIVGVEALIRWQSPERGLVSPAHFIPLLEETGLILQVGSWALKRAALDHRGWVEQNLKVPRVAVNVSQIQLRQRDFVGVVEQAIMDGMAPTGIDLEITESLVMEDVKTNIEKLKAVRGLGVRIAIDDFGTGYSSLGYLAQLPVESLKIDRSFIVKMQHDPNAMTLVSTIISLAHSLRLKVVAEGVETEDQAKFLRLLRCNEMQGYLFSKPVPAADLVKMLQAQAASL